MESPDSLPTELDELVGTIAEEFTQRLRNGEQPSVSAYLQQHPDVAGTLRQILPVLAIVEDLHQGSTPSVETMEQLPHREFGDYRIVRELGRGGMGVVYEAEQLSLRRRVALKVLPFAGLVDETGLKRFRNEAFAAAQLDHPHIVDVYGVGCDRGVHHYAMRFIEGRNLAVVLADWNSNSTSKEESHSPGSPAAPSTLRMNAAPTEPARPDRCRFRRVAEMGRQVADALAYAHEHGVVHRDIKPSNLLLDTQGKVWVTDFGLAQIEADPRMTGTGDLVGTLRYMSPEQASGLRTGVDHRSDIYSLGITLYELLTLRPAYPHEERVELLQRVLREDPPKPRRLAPEIPRELETIILKAIDRSPEGRYQHATEFADDLQRFLDDRPIRARPATVWQQIGKWTRRHRRLVAAVAIVLLFGIIGTAVATALVLHERQQLSEERLLRLEETQQRQHEQQRAAAGARVMQLHRYVSHINLAAQAWELCDCARVRELLDQCRPAPGEEDVRGFEWYLLQHQLEQVVEPFGWHEGPAYACCLSPDESILVSAGEDGVRIWDARTGEPRGHFQPHASDVNWISFSPDGGRFVTGSDDRTAKIWDASTWELVQSLDVGSPVSAVMFSPDGSELAIALRQPLLDDPDPTRGRDAVDIFDTSTWQRNRTLAPHSRRIHWLEYSADGRRIVTASDDNRICITDAGTGETIFAAHHPVPLWGASLAPDGRLVAGAGDDGNVYVWETQADGTSPTATLVGHRTKVSLVMFRPDSRTLVSSSRDGSVRIWPLPRDIQHIPQTLRASQILRHDAPLWCAIPAKKSELIYATGQDGRVTRWTAADRAAQLPHALKLPQPTTECELEFIESGERLVTASDRVVLHEWLNGAYRPRPLPQGERSVAVAVARPARRIAAGSFDGDLWMWDSRTGQTIDRWATADLNGGTAFRVASIGLAPDATLLTADPYVDYQCGSIWLNPLTGDVLPTPSPFSDPRSCGEISPDGQHITESSPGAVRFYRRDRPEEELFPPFDGGGPTFSSDGAWCAAGTFNGTVHVWNTTNWQLHRVFVANAGECNVALSSEGRTVAVASAAGLTLWHVETGRELFTLLRPPTEQIGRIRFAPDNRALAIETCSPPHARVLIWRIGPGAVQPRRLPHQPTAPD
ncbi:Serine/threonine-protein kinase PrkC [Maioricimonas rarisocia]|uniref:non-specific serine/threonine protein kinase n=1 Tax=Maioricimonas rarisocia TaxID=2528026 RepID=A0A517Z404_9PLAN|nr:protein kinase [Maioricimonas rarisocia]QDU37165.1 Serine/threonine-protein kinase PrkC [Maioricimonas rarisocia]